MGSRDLSPSLDFSASAGSHTKMANNMCSYSGAYPKRTTMSCLYNQEIRGDLGVDVIVYGL
jgi:hypothetical protein